MKDAEETANIPGWLTKGEGKASTVFAEAEEIIFGDREQTYGHPVKNLHAIAILWTAHILAKYGVEVPLNSSDVAWMMVQLKSAREMNIHKRDNIVDALGYIGLVERVEEWTKNEDTPS